MEFILLLVGWIVLSHVFAAIVPPLLELIPELICFIGTCLWQVTRLICRAVIWLLGSTIRLTLRLLRAAARRLWQSSAVPFAAREEEHDFAADDERPAEVAPRSPYGEALALLALTPDFTKPALKRAYRAAIRKAHPDAGGTARAAQAVNGAYELLLQSRGWGR